MRTTGKVDPPNAPKELGDTSVRALRSPTNKSTGQIEEWTSRKMSSVVVKLEDDELCETNVPLRVLQELDDTNVELLKRVRQESRPAEPS